MKTVSEARTATVRAWGELPPVSKLEVREVAPALAQALDELAATVERLRGLVK